MVVFKGVYRKMHSEFWHERWETGRIGFHQSEVNEWLQQAWPALQTRGEGRVLVPLCGKSLDMVWLREQGHEVTGVELNERACEAFWCEQLNRAVIATPLYQGDFIGREVEGLRTLCGDFFALPAAEFETVAWVYDRAALIAFPEPMRRRYAQMLSECLPVGVAMLLITLEFNGAEGPPFSVTEAEVNDLYGERFIIDKLHTEALDGRDATVYILRDQRSGSH